MTIVLDFGDSTGNRPDAGFNCGHNTGDEFEALSKHEGIAN